MSRLDNLEFLVDVVPRTVQYKQVKEKKAPAGVAGPSNTNGERSDGQTTLDGMKPVMNGTMNGFGHDGAPDDDAAAADPNAQLEMESRDARTVPGIVNQAGNEDWNNGWSRAPPDTEKGW